ncbi:hypothetical protein DXG01_007242 [Tephrocybe rancida]|nr:hypothetical protein DXG01_007242 [Tephrocybe rancida]
MNLQTSTQLPTRPTRKRTVSLSSLSSTRSSITLELPKADLTTVTVQTRSRTVYGSFIPTPSARPRLDQLKRASVRSEFQFVGRPGRLQIPTHHLWAEEEADSPLSSGPTSPSIPSFSRTASPPLVPPPPLTLSTIHESLARRGQVIAQRDVCELDPILVSLERKSKLLTKRVHCATCMKPGSDYPKCGRCDAMWCSRECRMVGGKRHVCTPRK